MTNIVTEAEAKEWLEIADYVDDQRISFIVASVSTMVANYCGRSFEVDTADRNRPLLPSAGRLQPAGG